MKNLGILAFFKARLFNESTYNEMVENDVDIVKTAFVVGFDKKMSYSQNWEGLLCPQTTSLH